MVPVLTGNRCNLHRIEQEDTVTLLEFQRILAGLDAHELQQELVVFVEEHGENLGLDFELPVGSVNVAEGKVRLVTRTRARRDQFGECIECGVDTFADHNGARLESGRWICDECSTAADRGADE